MADNTGFLGESLAAEYLVGKGFKIIDRNYHKKWGEIDIVAEKDKELYFIEVKAVSQENSQNFDARPEERVNPSKISKLQRIIRTYLLDKYGSEERHFNFLVMAVFIDRGNKKAFVRMIEDVI